jgi:hypothetical protein
MQITGKYEQIEQIRTLQRAVLAVTINCQPTNLELNGGVASCRSPVTVDFIAAVLTVIVTIA